MFFINNNRYNLLYLDFSWILTRNLYIVTKDKEPNEFNPGDIIRLTIQTIKKFARDYDITADKIIAITDLWEPSIEGYYRTEMLKNYTSFKGSRKFMTQEQFEEIKNNPLTSKEDLKTAERELAISNLKQTTKKIMLEELPKIGIYTYGKPGYEFDDIVTMASFIRGGDPNKNKKDVIVTVDSDLTYSLSPMCDLFRPKTSKTEGKVITYNDMYKKIPKDLTEKGISLYQYHALMDSLGYTGHNDLAKSRKPHTEPIDTILKILEEDYSNVRDIELFKVQMKTFDLSNFPKTNEIAEDINNFFETRGNIGTLDDFHEFCKTYQVEGISDRYYSEFIAPLDKNLYIKL